MNTLYFWRIFIIINYFNIISVKCQNEKEILKKIKATFGEFPGMVALSLRNSNNAPFCGGTIIDEYTIITAAHCLAAYPPNMMSVIACDTNLKFSSPTSNNRQIRNVDSVCPHRNFFLSPGPRFDIGLLYITEPFKFTDNCHSIKLANESSSKNQYCKTAGWGKTKNILEPKHLLTTKLQVVSNNECLNISQEFDPKYIVCAGIANETDFCNGDSGGPLICNERLEGLIAFGPISCEKVYTGYTKILSHIDFITNPNMTEKCPKMPIYDSSVWYGGLRDNKSSRNVENCMNYLTFFWAILNILNFQYLI